MRRVSRVVLGIIIVAAFVFFGDQACGQIEPPTAEQCQADARLWFEQSGLKTGYDSVRKNLQTLTVRQLIDRKQHLLNCCVVDHENADWFLTVNEVYSSEIADRYVDFILRHDLMGRFQKEDAAGLR